MTAGLEHLRALAEAEADHSRAFRRDLAILTYLAIRRMPAARRRLLIKRGVR